jgi:hypothetical protein
MTLALGRAPARIANGIHRPDSLQRPCGERGGGDPPQRAGNARPTRATVDTRQRRAGLLYCTALRFRGATLTRIVRDRIVVMPTKPTMMVALAVNIGNLGPMSPARRPMAELVRILDAALRARSGRVRVLDFFGHTGNFLVEGADRSAEVAQNLGRLLGTPCALVPIARVAEATAAAQAAAPPIKEAGQRWTPGVVFHVNGVTSSVELKDTHVARFQRLDDVTILAWKREVEDSRGRLDKKRRGGGWGAVSSSVARQLGGVWTARSATTLDGVLMRLEESPGG